MHRNQIGLILFLFSILSHSVLGWSEVGTPCPNGDECQPGEICAPGRLAGDPSFCTRRCGPDRPCPDAYICDAQGGLALCNTPIDYSQLGEACEPSCDEGLLCLNDGNEEYCSLGCTLPGSCPEGFRCRPGSFNACAKINSVHSIGEPCTEEEGCSADYECLDLPNRTLKYCTYACADIRCPEFMNCEGEGEEARCVHLPYQRILGDECVIEAQDSATIGCNEVLSCERNRDHQICTQDCNRQLPCPSGFGCVDRPDTTDPTIGRCMPDVDSSPGLEAEMASIMAGNDGIDPYEDPLPVAGSNSMDPMDSMGSTGMSTEEGGCEVQHRSQPLWLLIFILFTLSFIRSDKVKA